MRFNQQNVSLNSSIAIINIKFTHHTRLIKYCAGEDINTTCVQREEKAERTDFQEKLKLIKRKEKPIST